MKEYKLEVTLIDNKEDLYTLEELKSEIRRVLAGELILDLEGFKLREL